MGYLLCWVGFGQGLTVVGEKGGLGSGGLSRVIDEPRGGFEIVGLYTVLDCSCWIVWCGEGGGIC